jgi:ABC-type transporter MlaC component
MMPSMRLLAACAFATALTLGSSARADAGVDFIRTRQFLVTALLRTRPSEQRDRQVSAVLDRMFAFGSMAKRSLPDHWGALSEGQQAEYAALFKRLVQRSYERKMEAIVDHRIDFTSEPLELDEVLVHARATSGRSRAENEVPIAIDYELSPFGSSLKVVDVIAGGSSFVQQYKSKFQPIVEKDGFGALLEYMSDSLPASM